MWRSSGGVLCHSLLIIAVAKISVQGDIGIEVAK